MDMSLFVILIVLVFPETHAGTCITSQKADILLLLDESGSVSSSINPTLQFISDFTRMLGHDLAQFSICAFSTSSEDHRPILNFNNPSDLSLSILSKMYSICGYSTTDALEVVHNTMFKANRGSRASAMHVLIILTDGFLEDNNEILTAANRLKNDGITIFTIGMGTDFNFPSLAGLASKSSYVLNATDMYSLENLKVLLAKATCDGMLGCLPDMCSNGGTCIAGETLYRCKCQFPYSGWYCDRTLCETDNPCENKGECQVKVSKLACSCLPGFTGLYCQIDIDECANISCVHGTCVDMINAFICNCDPGYTGVLCSEDINECESNPCINGNCTDLVNEFLCTCDPGWTGATCEIDIDECASEPCQNGATCRDSINSFTCDCPPRYYGDFCETQNCQPSVADVIFVVDSSVSQTAGDFSKQLDFIINFIDHIVIGKENFQIAVITYSFEAVVEISIGEFNENVTLKEAVRKIQYRPGATFTDKGLQAAMDNMVTTSNKRPFNNIAKRYVFVMTDGLSTRRSLTRKIAQDLKLVATKVIAVGIGPEVSHKELLDIASPGDEFSPQYVFSINNFNALYTIVSQLVALTCDECFWNTTSDVVLVLDMSPSLQIKDFDAGVSAVTYITDMIVSRDLYNRVRLSMVTFGQSVRIIRNLNETSDKSSLIPEAQRLFIENGYCSAQQSSDLCWSPANNLDKALSKVQKEIFGKDKNKAREIVIILTSGRFKVSEELQRQISNYNTMGKFVFVVAMGDDANMEVLHMLVNDPAYIFTVRFQETPEHLDALSTELFYSSCSLSNNFHTK